MNTSYISAEQQISYRLTLLGATAAEHPYPGQLADLRQQIEELQQAFALFRIGQLAPIPTQGDQEVQENVR